MPRNAMIFAAGFGTRMGDLTKTRPKPMVEVAGKPLIDHALAFLDQPQVGKIVVNTHYLADQLEAHLDPLQNVVTLREEPDILETGGGLRNALPILGPDPVFTLNSDIIWPKGNPIAKMDAMWNPDRMDGLLALIPLARATGFSGNADFHLRDDGRIERVEDAAFLYTGIQIIKTDGLTEIDAQKFSLNILWDKMMASKRLFGFVFDGSWVDVGKPEGIALAEAELRAANG
ncbi:MAG: nucleotidyltransferase family protein [Pseudomonadota bacterium]